MDYHRTNSSDEFLSLTVVIVHLTSLSFKSGVLVYCMLKFIETGGMKNKENDDKTLFYRL